VTRPFIPDRTWYERRLAGFGASEAGPLLGISPWTTPRQVVESKGRRIIPDPDAPERLRLRMGRDMEPILLEHLWETLVERDGDAPRPRSTQKLWVMPGFDFVLANPDGFLGDAMVELKTDEYGQQPWGPEDGPPARVIPPTYYAQVQQGMAATRKQRALLFVQIGLSRQLLYEVPRDDRYVDDLVEYEAVMWNRVLRIRDRLAEDPDAPIEDLLPSMEGTELTEHLKREHPRSTELIRSAVTAEDEQALRDLRAARASRLEAERIEEVAIAKVQAMIGDAAGVTGAEGTVTWRTSADRTTTDWALIATSYRNLIRACRADPSLLATADDGMLDAIHSLYTHTQPGSRRFVVPRSWDR